MYHINVTDSEEEDINYLEANDDSEYRTNSHISLPDEPRESKRLKGMNPFEKTWEERDAGVTSVNTKSKLTRADRSNIRLLYACGYSRSKIAAEFGCSEMTITKYTGNSAVMEDNIESDDEHLDDKLLLRLRKEKRITIDVDLIRPNPNLTEKQKYEAITVGQKRKWSEQEPTRHLSGRSKWSRNPGRPSIRKPLILPENSSRGGELSARRSVRDLSTRTSGWMALSLLAWETVCAATLRVDRVPFFIPARTMSRNPSQTGTFVLYQAPRIGFKGNNHARLALGDRPAGASTASQCSTDDQLIARSPQTSISGASCSALSSSSSIISFLSSLKVDLSKHAETFLQLGLKDNIAIAALRSCPRSYNKILLRQTEKLTPFEIHVILCGLHDA